MIRLLKKTNVRGVILLPKKIVEKFGKEYYMEIYEDKIILIPAKEGE